MNILLTPVYSNSQLQNFFIKCMLILVESNVISQAWPQLDEVLICFFLIKFKFWDSSLSDSINHIIYCYKNNTSNIKSVTDSSFNSDYACFKWYLSMMRIMGYCLTLINTWMYGRFVFITQTVVHKHGVMF